MNQLKVSLLLLSTLAFIGCAPPSKTTPDGGAKGATNSDGSANGTQAPDGKPSSPPSGTPSASTTTDPAKPAARPASELPASLKNVAYEYYGLGNTKPLKLELRISGTETVKKGEQTVTFLGATSDSATFLIRRSGDLAIMGDSEVKLTKDGVYATKLSGKSVEPPQVEIPTNITAGRSWKSSSKVEMDQPSAKGTVEQTGVMKVIGFEQVKTKIGEFKALVLEETGVAKMNGQDNKISTRVWYAKGLGAVKMEVKNSVGSTTQTLSFAAVP